MERVKSEEGLADVEEGLIVASGKQPRSAKTTSSMNKSYTVDFDNKLVRTFNSKLPKNNPAKTLDW